MSSCNRTFKNYHHLILLIFTYLAATSIADCDIFIAPSRFLENNVGVFAGRKFYPNETMPSGIPIRIRKQHPGWQSNNYVFSSDSDESSYASVLELGISSLYNHHQLPNLYEHDYIYGANYPKTTLSSELKLYQLAEANSVYPHSYQLTNSEILPGDEIYISYGSAWFQNRGINLTVTTTEQSSYDSLKSLKKVGHCISNVYAKKSQIISQESPGQGVFAFVDFNIGDLVDISPILVLPKHEVLRESNQRSVLINFCHSRQGSDIALLPLGYGGLCNHGGTKNANVQIKWYSWSEKFNESTLDIHPDELLQSDSARMYFGYYAMKDIKKDEELLIDYGDEWELEWKKYLKEKQDHIKFKTLTPIFRRTIDLPLSIFPKQWYVNCVGVSCQDGEVLEELMIDFDQDDDEIISKVDRVTLHLSSLMEETINVYWNDDLVSVLQPGISDSLDSLPGHEFIAKVGDKIISKYVVTSELEQTKIFSN